MAEPRVTLHFGQRTTNGLGTLFWKGQACRYKELNNILRLSSAVLWSPDPVHIMACLEQKISVVCVVRSTLHQQVLSDFLLSEVSRWKKILEGDLQGEATQAVAATPKTESSGAAKKAATQEEKTPVPEKPAVADEKEPEAELASTFQSDYEDNNSLDPPSPLSADESRNLDC